MRAREVVSASRARQAICDNLFQKLPCELLRVIGALYDLDIPERLLEDAASVPIWCLWRRRRRSTRILCDHWGTPSVCVTGVSWLVERRIACLRTSRDREAAVFFATADRRSEPTDEVLRCFHAAKGKAVVCPPRIVRGTTLRLLCGSKKSRYAHLFENERVETCRYLHRQIVEYVMESGSRLTITDDFQSFAEACRKECRPGEQQQRLEEFLQDHNMRPVAHFYPRVPAPEAIPSLLVGVSNNVRLNVHHFELTTTIT